MPATVIDGDVGFSRGMDSVTDADTLNAQSYTLAVNMLNRGGALQTRPGFKRMFTLPSGQLQGLKVFTPRLGSPSLLAIVSGVLYASSYPFTDYQEVTGAHLSPDAKKVYSATGTKAVQKNADGSATLIIPKVVMVLQDGVNPAISYDGHVSATAPGVPQGTHMAWAGARLWVARREQIFAGDIADPLAFTEETYNTLGGLQSFLLSGHCTGLTPLPSSSSVKTPLVAFTKSVTTMFLANVLDRSQWPTITDFQSDLFPSLGCVAERSIVSQSGQLNWYSDFGTVRLDSASNTYVTSKIDFRDREMVRSSHNMDSDLSGICAASWENFLLTSVPHASKRNRHTWVFDASTNDLVNSEAPGCWASIWTGINPVEWASLGVDGRTRLFVASTDDDGKNRVYETFTSLRRDNCSDIPWAWESRFYNGQSKQRKSFRWVEYALSDIQGQLDMVIKWAGARRGPWKTIARPTFIAHEGSVDGDETYDLIGHIYALKKQSRLEKTEDVLNKPEDSLSSAGVEGPIYKTELEREAIDSSFTLRFEGSGQVAFRAVRIFADLVPEMDSGMQDNPETDDHFVRFDGAASKAEDDLDAEPEIFNASAESVVRVNNYSVRASASVASTISQSDADKRARQVSYCIAQTQLSAIAAPHIAPPSLPVPVATPATDIGTNSFTANWLPMDGAPDFRVDISTDSDFSTLVVDSAGTMGGNSYAASGLGPNVTYYYRVRAVFEAGTSGNSNVISATTLISS